MPNIQIQNPKNLLEKYGIKPSKKLGQNFLINNSVLEKIIKEADLSKQDTVIEIGPGLGILTIELAEKVKKVIAIEKDKVICDILLKIIDSENIKNVKIVNQDILQIPDFKFPHLLSASLQANSGQVISNQIQNSNFKIDSKFKIKNYKIIANIPYYLTSPLIRKFIENKYRPELIILMVQKEVAQRIIAKPPHMNLLAIAVQFYADAKIVNYVSKNSFWPIPKVDSAIIQITPRKNVDSYAEKRGINPEQFFKIVKAGFSSKRKFLINNLSRELKIVNCKLKIVFDQIGLGQKLRAENLSINDWISLYKGLKKSIRQKVI